MRFYLATGLLAILATPAALAGGLANGQYDCSMSMERGGIMVMGHMDIDGDTYRYRSDDKASSDFAPYAVSGDSISWGGGMGGLSEPPSVLKESLKTSYGFSVRFHPVPDGYDELMTCRHMEG